MIRFFDSEERKKKRWHKISKRRSIHVYISNRLKWWFRLCRHIFSYIHTYLTTRLSSLRNNLIVVKHCKYRWIVYVNKHLGMGRPLILIGTKQPHFEKLTGMTQILYIFFLWNGNERDWEIGHSNMDFLSGVVWVSEVLGFSLRRNIHLSCTQKMEIVKRDRKRIYILVLVLLRICIHIIPHVVLPRTSLA